MIWMLPLIGAAAGALMNKKDPLKGAMMGGALGMTGGAAAGGLLAGAGAAGAAGAGAAATGAAGAAAGAGAATGAAAGGSYAAGALGTAAGYGGMGAATVMPSAGLMGGTAAGTGLLSYTKPIGEALNAGMQVKSMLGSGSPEAPNQYPTAPPPPQYAGGSQILGQLSQQGNQDQQQSLQADTVRRKRRMSLLGDVA